MTEENFNRYNAISMGIVDPDTNAAPVGVPRFMELENSMYVFFGDAIFEILTPETIDPENKAPNTRPNYQKKYPVGCRNSWIARSIVQAHDMLSSLHLRNGLDKKNILNQVWTCTKLLLKCEAAHFDVYKQVMEKMHQCDAVIESNRNSSHIPSLPQVIDLEDRVLSFFNHAKKLLIEVHKLMSIFFDAPVFGAEFQKLRKWFADNQPNEEYILPMLQSDAPWIDLIRECRNAIEHPKANYKVDIANFKLYPGNRFSTPTWRYDLSACGGPTQENFIDIITDFQVLIENLLTFTEEAFLLSLKSNWHQGFPFEVYKNSTEQINKECPTLYYVSMKQLTPKA